MSENTRKMDSKALLKRFLPYYKPYLGILAFDLTCACLTSACDLVLPLIVREVTQTAISDPLSLTTAWILRLGLLYIVLRIIDIFATYYMSSIGHIMGSKLEGDMRSDMFSHLQKLSLSFFDNTKVGTLMSRMTTDLFDVTEFSHHCPEEFLIAFLKITIAFGILINVNVSLTLILFAILPFMFLGARYFNLKMRTAFRTFRRESGELNAQLEDSLLGIRVVRSFTNEAVEENKFETGNRKLLKARVTRYHNMAGFHAAIRFFDAVMYIAVVVVGGLFLVKQAITPGDYVAYLLYVSTLLTSIRRVVEYMDSVQNGLTGVERFCEIMDTPVEINDPVNAVDLIEVKGKVEFKDVSFGYEDGKSVLSHISFTANPGANIALVGPSGAGKTTICNLIQRFYDVQGGAITIDDIDIRDLTQSSLRSHIGVVQQEVYLFSGTIYENILYGKLDASREDVIKAAKMAGVQEFVQSLPQGYDTYVGERGMKLSGGQKQRISIARVFLKNPPILVLDEATSSLDNENERIVQNSLRELAKDRTTFTIAHRLTTIRNADMILVLTDKGIVEQGTHSGLMKKKGVYSELYKLYSITLEE